MMNSLPYEILGKIFEYCKKIIHLRRVCTEFKYMIDEHEYFNLDNRKIDIYNTEILTVIKKITNVKHTTTSRSIYKYDDFIRIKTLHWIFNMGAYPTRYKLPTGLVRLYCPYLIVNNWNSLINLIYIDCSNTNVTNLCNLKHLETLICRFCNDIIGKYLPDNIIVLKCNWSNSIKNIIHLKKLEILHCTGCYKILDKHLPENIIELRCGQTYIKNIHNLSKLKKLYANMGTIIDTSIPINLIELDYSNYFQNSVNLSHLINLKELTIYKNNTYIMTYKNLPINIISLKCTLLGNFDYISHLNKLKKLHILVKNISNKYRKIKNCVITYK